MPVLIIALIFVFKMDLEHAEKILEKIRINQKETRELAYYCVTNSKGSEAEISKMLERSFQSHFLDQRLAIFMVVSEIFIMTGTGQQKDARFFKFLSQKAKAFIEEFSRRCNEIKPQHIHIVPECIAKWATPGHQLFAATFMEKLKKIAEPIILAAKKAEEDKKNGIYENYTKTFLMEYEDTKSYEPTSRIYDDYRKFTEIATQIGSINQQTKRLSLENPTNQIRERAKILKERLEVFSTKLQDIICGYHVDFKILREACQEQFDKLPLEAKKLLQESKQ